MHVVTELLGLEDAIAPLLPAGVSILELCLEGDTVTAQLKAPVVGACTFSARAQSSQGQFTLSSFSFTGAGFMSSMVLGKIQHAISSVDSTHAPFHIWGEPDGDRLHISWLKS